jgi:glutamine amidotransferase
VTGDSLAVIDYGAGNLRSVQNALAALGFAHAVTSDPEVVRRAATLIVPGDGEASSAMATLERTGLGQAIRETWQAGRALIGICLGCQVILERSEEGDTRCLGLLPGVVRSLPRTVGLKVPHMGWNGMRRTGDHPALASRPRDGIFYFVHSYYADPANPRSIGGLTEYGIEFASCIAVDNLVAFQFHPEKSGREGLELLTAVLAWSRRCC